MDGVAVAIVHREAGAYGVSFPDFPGVVAAGGSAAEALARATTALSFHIAGMVEDSDPIPGNRTVNELRADPEFCEDADGAEIALVPFWIRSDDA
jgi:predicted RNase H-like HicB family nuclease